MVNLEEQIKLLVELQGLDTQIFKLMKALESIPEEIRNMEEAFEEKMSTLKQMEDGLRSLQVKRKEKEVDLEAKEGTIRKYQIQLYQIKTNKEYTALAQEIARVKADNSLLEEEIIKMLDKIDIENQKISKERGLLKSEEIKLSEEKVRKGEEAKRIEGELGGLKAQRIELAGKVDGSILPKYERIIRSKDGLAVVPVAGDACQGCFRILPPQVINEIKMRQELIFCDNCARILYIEE